MSYSSEVLADSPVIWLKADEASGGLLDSGSDGTGFTAASFISYQQPPLVTDGLYSVSSGGGGIGYRSSCPASLAGENVTQEVWFNMPSGNQKGMLTHVGTGSAGWGVGIGNGSSTNNVGRKLMILVAGVAFYDLGHTLSDGVHHVVVAHTTTNNFTVYVDAVQVFSGTLGTPPSAGARVNVGLLELAGYSLTSGIRVDHPAFYASALSSTRVSAHYSAGTGAEPSLTLGASLPGLTSVISLDAASPVSLAATLPGLASAFTLDVALPPEITLAGTLPGLSSTFAAEVASPVTLAGQVPGLTSAFTLTAEEIRQVTLAGSLPGLSAAFDLAKPPETDTRNRVGGRTRGGYGVATWEPPVVAPPASVAPAHVYDVLEVPLAAPVVTNGRPAYTVDRIAKPRHRDRILVGGKDITYFRGAPTPPPSFRLVEPFLYGAGTLTIPQVSPAFERLGVGSLRWLRKYAPVVIQRVDQATGAVVATDYRGFITDFHIRGNNLTLDLGGRVSGWLALQDTQPPVFRSTLDAGARIYRIMRWAAGVNFQPHLGPTTGIALTERAGGSMLDHAHELLAMTTTIDGDQWTVGQRANGTWGMWLKDTSTIDATVYFDDSRMVADLHRAVAEEPNRIFASGVAPDGRRIKNAKYPGLKQGETPRYPFANEATTFGVGTSNADTDYPDLALITAYKSRLATFGYLSITASETYDADWVAAVEQLQSDAGLSQTGITNLATWRAAFDLDATGYSLNFARIDPMAQHPKVKRWHTSSSGALTGRNAAFDPNIPFIDRTVGMGSGLNRQQIQRFSNGILREADTPNWVGTLTANLALVRGEHAIGTLVTEADLMPAREIRPGMNIWAPLFDGGTLFHVSGVSVPGGGAVELTLDTRARDTMAAWEVIARNRESRTNPARAWLNANRPSGASDTFFEWDDVAGIIEDDVAVAASRWTVFPVVAGQAGTVSQLRIALADSTKFAVAVFAREIAPARLDHLVPDPLSEAGSQRWDKEWVRDVLYDRGWVYQAGGFEQACGYFPGRETNDQGEASGDALTGEWRDDTGFGYETGAYPVLYVAIYPQASTKVEAGRIMWSQLEGGAP